MESTLDAPWLDVAHDTVSVWGGDAASYLQSQVSQDIGDLAVGDRRWTFLLEPSGRVEVLALIERVAQDRFDLRTDAGFGAVLLERVNRFKIRVDVTTELTEVAGAPDAPDELERLRVERGWPKMGTEIVPGETIPAETGVTSLAVSFTKGCYPGQELVERMDSRGAAAPRSLRRLEVAHGSRPGDAILDGLGADVGTLTSVAGTWALGYVKRGHDLGEPVRDLVAR